MLEWEINERELLRGVANINKILNGQTKFATSFLKKFSRKIVSETKKITPVRSEKLKRGWRYRKLSDTKYSVYNRIFYTPYVELGFTHYRSKKFVKGRQMLTKALEKAEKQIPQILKGE
jgi:hypothetical protein